MKSDLVTLEKHGRVGILRLNDPKRLNPMTADMGKALQGGSSQRDRACRGDQRRAADEFGAIVLTGEGRAVLCWWRHEVSEGPDLGHPQSKQRHHAGILRTLHDAAHAQDAARGGDQRFLPSALDCASHCLLTCASLRRRQDGFHIRQPWTPSWNGELALFCRRLSVPRQQTISMLTGKVFDGVEAQQLRLVNKAVPTDRGVDEAMQIATEMAVRVVDGGGAASSRRCAPSRTLDSTSHCRERRRTGASSYAAPDYAEGLQAIAEKRAPQFGGFEHYNLQ
ncbi:hypothetical protein PINS_up020538 [Pythium insidiosum]|nr:hypothetical protein PINS_up020538 [Pythium insidiosum]